MGTIEIKQSRQNADVIIIGAGASGLMAANILLKKGKKILLLEKKHQAGLKLRITGKGRCNVTNACEKAEYLSHISDKNFFKNAFESFDNRDLMHFFEQKGIELVVERGKRVFPKSGKSLDIFFALLKEIEQNPNVTFIKNCSVTSIIVQNGKAIGVKTTQKCFYADNIIVATGGKSYPRTGSNGDGYMLLRALNHTIIEPIPALVGLKTMDGYSYKLQNLGIKNCEIVVTNDKHEEITRHFGDITLMQYGVSGPVILTISREIARRIHKKERLFLTIDLKYRINKEKLYDEILQTFAQRRTENAASVLRKWFIKPLLEDVLQVCKINPQVSAYKLSQRDAKQLLWYMKNRRQKIVGLGGWDEAIITMGGVNLREIDDKTMQSKKVRNLYVVGELLDLDADTGGYNLQIAFSTAHLAAQSI